MGPWTKVKRGKKNYHEVSDLRSTYKADKTQKEVWTNCNLTDELIAPAQIWTTAHKRSGMKLCQYTIDLYNVCSFKKRTYWEKHITVRSMKLSLTLLNG